VSTLENTHPTDWTREQELEWIERYRARGEAVVPNPLHPREECDLCDVIYRLLDEAEGSNP
jgi:hypothetical protein